MFKPEIVSIVFLEKIWRRLTIAGSALGDVLYSINLYQQKYTSCFFKKLGGVPAQKLTRLKFFT
eukprot:UN06318